MFILSSSGFSTTQVRMQIGEIIADKTGNMLIIPIASLLGMETAERERNCAAMLGFKKENIYIYDELKPTELLDMKFSYIAVLGGHTLRLLSKVRELHLDTFIKEQVANGAVYLGFSAGAYLACDDIEYVKNYDTNDDGFITDGNFHALGFTDKYVLCHFDCRDEKDIQLCRLYIGDEPELITLNNDQVVVLPQKHR